jgi:hypothetical protein
MTSDGVAYTEPGSICSEFNKYFTSVHVRDVAGHSDLVCDHSISDYGLGSIIDSPKIDCLLVRKYIDKIDVRKGSGCDGIPGIFIKNSSSAICVPLSIIFNKSLCEGCVPSEWKKTLVSPIFKSGDRNNVSNYRPISKLTLFSKLLEKIIFDHIRPMINPYLADSQHGFRCKKSVDSNLLEFTHFVVNSSHEGFQVDALYTDFAKAFDKINHRILLRKLWMFGFRGDLYRWFKSYIQNRSQAVALHGYTSGFEPIYSGVPQGSHLGPLLFLLYINDMEKCLKNTSILLFADDAKIYRRIGGVEDCIKLQSDVDALQVYCASNQLYLNIDKCNIISYTRNKNKIIYVYKIGGVNIKRKTEMRDLGIVLDEKLNFVAHFDHVVSRAFGTLGFIFRNTRVFRDPRTLIVLFNSLIRSLLEFGSTVWNPNYIVHIESLERLQKKCIKQLNFRERLHFNDYEAALRHHRIQSLETRRLIIDLTYLHKIINGYVDSSVLLEALPFHCPLRTTRNESLFYVPHGRTNYARNSFINRVSMGYNRICMKTGIDLFSTTARRFRSSLRELAPL